jgi:3-oxoacyl-[acyl-carrier protein] reductase
MVVGAAFDMGQGIAKAFALAGARVYACDILADAVGTIAGAYGKGRIATGYVNALDEQSVAEAVRAACGENGLYGLVYVAGGVAGQIARPVEDVSLEQWRAVLDINVTGLFLCARAVVPGMKRRGQGRIVAISSRAGLAPSLTGIQAYCAAKHAENGLIRQLGQELAPHGITVNAIASGFMCSGPSSREQWEGYSPEFQKSFTARLAGGRTGRHDDIAAAALFLASDQAQWITGQILPVTGEPL